MNRIERSAYILNATDDVTVQESSEKTTTRKPKFTCDPASAKAGAPGPPSRFHLRAARYGGQVALRRAWGLHLRVACQP